MLIERPESSCDFVRNHRIMHYAHPWRETKRRGDWFAVRLRELTTEGSGESYTSAEQNLRAWAENRRTVNARISQECLPLALSPAVAIVVAAVRLSIIMRAARSSSHERKELLHLRGLLHERRGSTALSHAIVEKWTPNNWRQPALAGNYRAVSSSNYPARCISSSSLETSR